MINDQIVALFNRGIVSRKSLARVDVERIALSAETQTNWMPRTLGPMSLREGWEMIGQSPDDGAYLDFVFDKDDNAILELTPNKMRVWDGGTELVTRPDVDTAVDNGDFVVSGGGTGLPEWTDASDGSVANWGYIGLGGAGRAGFFGTGSEAARMRQELTVAPADRGVLHALRIDVDLGPFLFRVGTTAGADNIVRQIVLRTGQHSIAFTPTGSSFWIEFASIVEYRTLLNSVQIESAGVLELPTLWATVEDCKSVRKAQSNDVVYCASNKRPQRIERRANNSWSVVDYTPNDGPFEGVNTENITVTPDALTGNVTITASQPIFGPSVNGSLFRIASQGQRVEADIATANTFSNPVLVTGTGSGRVLQVVRAGTWAGTLTLQRSVGDIGNWVDVKTYSGNGTDNYNDSFDNSDIWYRIGFKTGDYTSGTAEVTLDFPSGSIIGTVLITLSILDTIADGIILKPLGGTDPTTDWAEGSWSDALGYPTAVSLYQGRLEWGGRGRFWASISDAFDSFDSSFEGDAGPIARAIGDGPVHTVQWMLALERLMVGTSVQEQSIRSNSFDEPITPSNYNSKTTSRKGCAAVPPAASDTTGYFVGRTGTDVYELAWRPDTYAYQPVKANLLVPEIGDATFVRIAMQEEPDVRLHCVRGDGTAAVLIRDAAEDVKAWIEIETDGFIEDVVVLPSDVEDRVFYRVRRVIDGNTVRFLERWDTEGTQRHMDCHISGTNGSGVTSITGLTHLEGEEVCVWARPTGETGYKDLGRYTVASGAITVSESVDAWTIGLPYEATYKSAKMAIRTALGIDMNKLKRIVQMGLVLVDTHYQGLRYGSDFDTMDELPLVERGAVTADDTIWTDYDQQMFEFNGEWDTDSRLCLKAASPRPATVLAAVIRVDRS